ncbi:MAG TPA: DUF1772 domain-containing protein [Devosia sp.]|nr:DUF1772 domain-containing protein [Devosia sp.]
MLNALPTGAQVLALLLVGLVAGSMFGIWRGYDPAAFSSATFLEVHQGAVRGLNTLLPAMAIAALVLTVLLAFFARTRPTVLWLYIGAALLIAVGGAITRLANQPINEQVMAWTAATMPANWTALRDSWWTWHLARLAATLGAQLLLIAAVFADRDSAA